MGHPFSPRGIARAALAASSLLLSGCLLTPGAFTAQLTLSSGGGYAFAYDGEIAAVGLSQLARMGDVPPFEPACIDDEQNGRKCTAEETAEQKAEWDERQARETKDKERMVRAIGGIDPSDPEAAQKLADTLSRQAGFRSVVHKGDGVYAVKYAAEGRLSHGFVFPLVDRMPTVTPFVVAIPRADGSVRVEAPGFGGEPAFGDPATAIMMGAASPGSGRVGSGRSGSGGSDSDGPASGRSGAPAPPPAPDGTFTIVTDGRILTNNTAEGPQATAAGKVLRWDIDAATRTAPTALIAF
ncbi:MAG TPA: hypothetical protein VHN58_01445 [Croceicoccus sp.]|nr:hypothetical protein [Croceicoccus sp.]